MTRLQLITLLMDLGITDAYVGIVKGVLYVHAPNTMPLTWSRRRMARGNRR